MYGNERGRRRGRCARPASTATRSTSRASSTTASTSPTTRGARSTARSQALGSDYVDLFLIHWPLPTLYDGDFVSTWRDARGVPATTAARARSASPTSRSHHLERLARRPDVVPAVNQIELHPYFQNRRGRAYGREHGIATEAWSPIAQGQLLDDPVIGEIAARLGRSPAQVVLRWHIERGNIVFPKSSARGADARELRRSSTSSSSPRTSARIDALDRGEDGTRSARARTCSTTSPPRTTEEDLDGRDRDPARHRHRLHMRLHKGLRRAPASSTVRFSGSPNRSAGARCPPSSSRPGT